MPKRKLAKETDAAVNQATHEVKTNGHKAAPAKKKRRVSSIEDEIGIIKEDIEAPTPEKKKQKKRGRKKRDSKYTTKEEKDVDQVEAKEEDKPKEKKKRKTKEQKEAEAMPIAVRTKGHRLFIGAHVSSAGGSYIFNIAYIVENVVSLIDQASTNLSSTVSTSARMPSLSS